MMFDWEEFWIAVAFVIFVALLYRPVRKSIVGALDARATKIRAELDEARHLREEAQATLAAYQRKQRQALKEADEIIAHAEQEAELIRHRTESDLETALKRREKMAVDRIAQAEAEAVQEVREMAADIAVAATRELLIRHLDETKTEELIDEAIAEMPKKLH